MSDTDTSRQAPRHRRAPNAWNPPASHELPDLRSQLAKWADNKVVVTSFAQNVHDRAVSVVPMTPAVPEAKTRSALSAALLARAEKQRLQEATLWHAAGDMPSLAVAVAASAPIERFSMDRLPSLTGFMLFDEPIGGYTRLLKDSEPDWNLVRPDLAITTPIVAASWSLWQPSHLTTVPDVGLAVRWCSDDGRRQRPIPADFDGVWITFYNAAFDPYGELDPSEPLLRRRNGSIVTAADLHALQGTLDAPALMWNCETVVPFGADLSAQPEPDSKAEWLNVLYTAWQLMSQPPEKTPMVEVDQHRPGSARRHRYDREGITGPHNVRVVHVHPTMQPTGTAREQDTAASSGRRQPHVSYRWEVAPHRRNQCYNPHGHADGNCEHADIIVRKHVNGPIGAPLRDKHPTVHVWDQQP